ncbi:hypothetical protein NEMBOFW57_009747 [Staphylotrichum longicolle]|uniref:RGS domain-containing protein n=1 Tax=Staphylotrichum longicolle TaxID=669026 RepID=A0AAD4EPW2_9PEZI|nr:hypothetical protein NEMBOFW57_009747 [Staphylotrichum longicolle]
MAGCEPSSKARTQFGDVPVELSFEEIIKNQTASPCSLNDFMDYLFYVERSAENLQFFLWYWDYIQRWSNLLPRQKALSPLWDPEQAAEPRSRFIKYSHKRARSLKMSKVLAIMEMDSERALSESPSPDPSRLPSPLSSPTSLSRASTSILSPGDAPKDWQPFTIQPFRDEIRRVTRHYLQPSAPRQLRLSPRDRASCLRAGQHTTHPSALHPAFLTAEAHLRAHSHAAFLRWARRNANPPRVLCLRALGALLVILGLAADLVLILSGLSVYLRAACVALWWPGLTVLVSAWQGVVVVVAVIIMMMMR